MENRKRVVTERLTASLVETKRQHWPQMLHALPFALNSQYSEAIGMPLYTRCLDLTLRGKISPCSKSSHIAGEAFQEHLTHSEADDLFDVEQEFAALLNCASGATADA
jgi:hypothetical protein